MLKFIQLTLFTVVWCAATALAAAETCCAPCQKRTGDQLWLVSTRQLGCCAATKELPKYGVHYYAEKAWHASNVETFAKHDQASLPTVIYVHGNRDNANDAVEEGWTAYCAYTRCLPADQQVRFVVWSWPSDKDGGPLRDVRRKACRTLVEGYYLARFMTRIDPQVPTGIIGYSFGARVTLGALHLSGGGTLDGRALAELPPTTRRYDVALLAAAVEDDGFLPGGRFGCGPARVNELVNLYNSCDRALKRYPMLDRCERPDAMGYVGIAGVPPTATSGAKMVEVNISGIVGRSHDDVPYFQSETIMRHVRHTLSPH